jgi:DAK2 domain fusion protein YloV
MARAGLAWLETHYEVVNSLNVFPVPDGDTGTNMLLTMRSAYKEIADSKELHAGKIAQMIYQGALMGARGNSGVILSQLWRGFSSAIEEKETFDTEMIASGFEAASQTAYRAVQEPVEGTILTVAREAAAAARLGVQEDSDVIHLFERIVNASRQTVERTPEMLAVLREAGVVDSGGMGLTYILEGMLRSLRGEELEPQASSTSMSAALQSTLAPTDELGYGYDVQFLLKGENLNVDEVRADIEAMGDSTLVVGDSNLIKVHVHVHNPGVPVGYGADRGVLLDVVVENMQEQYQGFVANAGPLDTRPKASTGLPEIEPGRIAVVTVAPGEGLTEIFYSMGAGRVISGGQTMNPSSEDFLNAIMELATDKIVLLPNNKNILMTASTAASLANEKDVRVVATTTIPQGLSALLSLDPQGDLSSIVDAMEAASDAVETGEVTTATRNVTVNGVKVKQGQIIGLHNDLLRIAGNDVNSVVVQLLEEMGVGSLELITMFYGDAVAAQEAETLAEHLATVYPDHDIEIQNGGQAHYFYILSAE